MPSEIVISLGESSGGAAKNGDDRRIQVIIHSCDFRSTPIKCFILG